LNIIIPMAGLGSRFPRSQYPTKPLIDVKGKPMIIQAVESLDLNGRYYFVIRKDRSVEEIKQRINGIVDSTFIEIDHITEGPAITALMCSDLMDKNDELVIANCDQIMEWNSKLFLHNARLYDGCIVTYHSDTPKNSYARLDRNGCVVELKEKEVISNVSLNGIHYWRRAQYFIDSANEMIEANDRAPNNEFYVAPTYNYMIKQGLTVGIFHIPNEQHNAVGTPEDLDTYLKK
jgi:dTDP-glucose pyrophosphorylase